MTPREQRSCSACAAIAAVAAIGLAACAGREAAEQPQAGLEDATWQRMKLDASGFPIGLTRTEIIAEFGRPQQATKDSITYDIRPRIWPLPRSLTFVFEDGVLVSVR